MSLRDRRAEDRHKFAELIVAALVGLGGWKSATRTGIGGSGACHEGELGNDGVMDLEALKAALSASPDNVPLLLLAARA